MARPIIGICANLEVTQYGVWEEKAAFVPLTYVASVQRAGGLALVLPPDEQLNEDPDEALDLIDGLILAGGADIDPAAYGAERHPKTTGTTRERDEFEIALAKRALERDIPLLGVCRGMQLMNVARGGTLIQHVPEAVGHEHHRRIAGTFEGNDHPVHLEPGSLVSRAAGEEHHHTLSHHHQGVDRLGDGFVVTGWSEVDELPEAIELPDRRFALGVQWHPEADDTSRIIETLVEEARTAKEAAPAAD